MQQNENGRRDYSQFEGPTEHERWEAMRAYNARRRDNTGSGMQSGDNLMFGTPRLGKHNRNLKAYQFRRR